MLKRLLIGTVILIVAFICSIAVVGWLLARPVPVVVGPPPLELNAQTVRFPSESGAEVQGWWCPSDQNRGSILLLPGVRANRLSMVARAKFLRAAGYSTLLIDLQGTGETKGERITFGWRESRDVLAAVAFLQEASPGGKIGIIGSSLGGAATLLAVPPLRVDAMVLEAVYPTIARATDHRLRKYLGSAGGLLAWPLLSQMQLRLGVSADQLRPIDHIAAVGCPVLIINGTEDPNTTAGDASELFERAAHPKELWLVEGAGHVDLHRVATAEYQRRVLKFFARM